MRLSGASPKSLVADRRLLAPAAILAVWTVVAAAAALQALALVRLDGRSNVLGAVLGRVSIIPLWALATPLILRSARRFPVVDANGRVSPVSAAIHLVLGSLFIVLTNAVIRLPLAFSDAGGIAVLGRSTMQGVAEYYPPALVVYGVIVAIGHVVFRGAHLDRGTLGTLQRANAPMAVADRPAVAERPADAGGPAADDSTDAAPKTQSVGAAAVAALDGHLTVRQWNRVHLVPMDDIDFVEAEDNYVVVHAASRRYKGRDRISDVESQLDARRFVRIHRSTIVQLAKIREVQPLTHGDHAVILRDGRVLRVARSRRQALGTALGIEL
jgi:DNA-binding LytR/AlgR family response regulator